MKIFARVGGLPFVAALVDVLVSVLFLVLVSGPAFAAAPRKSHVVVLGAAKNVPYSRAGDPAGATADEDSLKVRALLIDGLLKEWTTGDAHDVTDRSFVVRRAVRLNNSLPGEKLGSWVWQRGPWLLVDHQTGHITALHLPDYDPGLSQVSWFRDYAAYCGLTPSGKSLYAVVAQIAARRPVLAKKLSAFDPQNPPQPICTAPDWQRQPMRVTFHPGGPGGKDGVAFDVEAGSAVLVEDSGDEPETPEAAN